MTELKRTTDGTIDNCALANGDTEQNCQMCIGNCPDRARFGFGEEDVRVRSEIQTLIARGHVTREEVAELRLNSWEWEALVVALDREAFVAHVEHALKNSSQPKRPCSTYDEALIVVHVPELIKRYQRAATAADEFAGTVDGVREALGQKETHYLVVAGDVKELVEAVQLCDSDGGCRAMPVLKRLQYDAEVVHTEPNPRWGVYCLDGLAQDTWCQHTEGHRIETDERTARTIALLFHDRSMLYPPSAHYEARRLP